MRFDGSTKEKNIAVVLFRRNEDVILIKQRQARRGPSNARQNGVAFKDGTKDRRSVETLHPSSPAFRPEPADEQLLAAYREGDVASFADLVSRYQRELFHFLVRFLGDRAAAEDVFQEAFLQVHQSAEQFDLDRRFKPWLFTIAANKARDMIRSRARRPTSPLQAAINSGDDESGEFLDLMSSASAMPYDDLERQELQMSVQKTVMAMPEHLREILLLSYFHQFPYKQISEILDIPLGTVKSRLHAAVAFFADRWRVANLGRSAS